VIVVTATNDDKQLARVQMRRAKSLPAAVGASGSRNEGGDKSLFWFLPSSLPSSSSGKRKSPSSRTQLFRFGRRQEKKSLPSLPRPAGRDSPVVPPIAAWEIGSAVSKSPEKPQSSRLLRVIYEACEDQQHRPYFPDDTDEDDVTACSHLSSFDDAESDDELIGLGLIDGETE